jgi:phosphoheptose isomerase
MNSSIRSSVDDAIALFHQTKEMEQQVKAAADCLSAALTSGHKLLACGNGGSAAEAAHLTTEFVCRFGRDRRPYPAISLSSHGGDLTAIGNDYCFEDLFARQVGAFGAPGDVLVAFSSSGNSENVRRAIWAARDLKMVSIALLGGDGGKCLGLADIDLLVKSKITARVQEAHLLLVHLICEIVEDALPA